MKGMLKDIFDINLSGDKIFDESEVLKSQVFIQASIGALIGVLVEKGVLTQQDVLEYKEKAGKLEVELRNKAIEVLDKDIKRADNIFGEKEI